MLDQSSDSLHHSKPGAPAITVLHRREPKIARWRNGKRTYRSAVTLLRNVQPGKLPSAATYQTDPVSRSAQLLENNNRIRSHKEIPRSGNTLTRAPRGFHDHRLRRCEVVSDVVEMRRDRQSTFIT
jgi:hypothetical protein